MCLMALFLIVLSLMVLFLMIWLKMSSNNSTFKIAKKPKKVNEKGKLKK